MEAYDILAYISIIYKGDWAEIFNFIKNRKDFDEEEAERVLKACPYKYISINSKDYPDYLLQLPRPPFTLFYEGDISLLQDSSKIVSVVGSRQADEYGIGFTNELVQGLVEHEMIICSGLARGVDAAAHRAAILNKGKTIAFVANGLDRPFPTCNKNLYKEIVKYGGLVATEYPPGVESTADKFNCRNRLIAGCCDKLLVTQAFARSGTLLTVRHALCYGKEIYCVPDKANSGSACNALIKEGAMLTETVEDILDI